MDDGTAAHAASPPNHILGYAIRSRTRIYVSYIIPSALELAIYIAQIVADCAVSYEHFHSHQPNFGWATLSLIFVPPVLTFVFVLSSRDQWANPVHANRWHFVGYQLLQMLLFPLFAVYRFAKRVFWSIEALFHEDNDAERMLCLERAEECSTCELYHLIQAYGQSAPQIILQLYHMLTQDLFRNFQTTNVQAISLVFSAIDLAAITTTYQRFESQRQVGRHYPWSPPQQVAACRQTLAKDARLRCECQRKQRDSQRTIASFPESEKIMANFRLRTSAAEDAEHKNAAVSEAKTHEIRVEGLDEVDNDALETHETTVLLHSEAAPRQHNATDDDKLKVSPKLRLHSIREEMRHLDAIEILDTAPDSPAPPLPPTAAAQMSTQISVPAETPQLRTQISNNSDATTNSASRQKRASKSMSQLDTYKNMLIVNAQLYIRDHMPRPPKMLLTRLDNDDDAHDGGAHKAHLIPISQTPPSTPMTPKDVVDFFLPRPTKIVNGIQQDDFASKSIAFFGWIAFIVMRMLALSTFCVFFPKAFFIVVAVHYLVMAVSLFLESRFRGKLNRTLFYLLLAYVYIFVLLEFRIKFKRIRVWYIGFFVITMAENITMTMLWYAREEFESWWFGFIFEGIIYSGILLVATLLVYYVILKPKDVNLIVEDEGENKENS